MNWYQKFICLQAQFSPQINKPVFRLGKKPAVQHKSNLEPTELPAEDAPGQSNTTWPGDPGERPRQPQLSNSVHLCSSSSWNFELILALHPFAPRAQRYCRHHLPFPRGTFSCAAPAFAGKRAPSLQWDKSSLPYAWGPHRIWQWPDLTCKEF